MLRTALKTATAWAVSRTGYDAIARLGLHRSLPFIIGYHRVVERLRADNVLSLPAMEIRSRGFERNLDWVAKHSASCRSTSGSKLGPIRLEEGRSRVTLRTVYSDILPASVPSHAAKKEPGRVFVVTDLVGTTRLPIHEELHAALAGSGAEDAFSKTQSLLQRLPQCDVQRIIDAHRATSALNEESRRSLQPMSWEMLAEMRDGGMTIGSHSRSHAFLANETEERVREEVEGSRQELQRRLHVPAEWFAYPGGSFNAAVVRAVAKAGYRYGIRLRRMRPARIPNHDPAQRIGSAFLSRSDRQILNCRAVSTPSECDAS